MPAINKESYLHKGVFELSSGKISDEYWNFRPMLTHINAMWPLALEIEKNYKYANLIGVEFFGAMLVSFLHGFLNRKYTNPLFWRKEKDKTGQQLYGELDLQKPIYIVDDVITTGKSINPLIELFLFTYLDPKIMAQKILVLKNRTGSGDFRGIEIVEIGEKYPFGR